MTNSALLCAYCNQPVDPRERGTYRKVEGWVRPRPQGGTNSLKRTRETDEYMHTHCMQLSDKGISSEQEQLFAEAP